MFFVKGLSKIIDGSLPKGKTIEKLLGPQAKNIYLTKRSRRNEAKMELRRRIREGSSSGRLLVSHAEEMFLE
ncbi:hypothetical protein CHH65_12495 [Shouchella clausii]|nr:hypothetical protein CHH65_12495 [Shouchella clausii]